MKERSLAHVAFADRFGAGDNGNSVAVSGDGSVIAESKKNNLDSFLGMHYLESNIPESAKRLHTLNWLRSIEDVNCEPSKLVNNCQKDH